LIKHIQELAKAFKHFTLMGGGRQQLVDC